MQEIYLPLFQILPSVLKRVISNECPLILLLNVIHKTVVFFQERSYFVNYMAVRISKFD